MRTAETIRWQDVIPFAGMHLACWLVVWTGVSRIALIACAGSYAIRMFGITAGYHRYFSHRSYRTGRLFQFVLAWLGASAAQKGPLWWAAHHRHHHAYSDTQEDVHSPVARGFWWSHLGWFLCRKYDETDLRMVGRLSTYPELCFLNRNHLLPPVLLAATLFVAGLLLNRTHPDFGTSGLQLLVWGFFVSTVLLYHGTFIINSLAHVIGRRRFNTNDESRNSFWIALVTLGEGWHNNHHYAPSSERQGFFWWEIDVSHDVLVVLSWLGIVWDLHRPPVRVYRRV